MRFRELRDDLIDKGLSRKEATLGARAVLGVDTVEDWAQAVGFRGQPLLTAGEFIRIEALGLLRS
jgi:hypothetical protein